MLGRRGTSIGADSPYRFRGVPASPAWCTTRKRGRVSSLDRGM